MGQVSVQWKDNLGGENYKSKELGSENTRCPIKLSRLFQLQLRHETDNQSEAIPTRQVRSRENLFPG